MKKLITILFLLISVSVFSQVRTNVFRVAGDSTVISSLTVVPSSLVIDAESNTLYVLPTGCAAGERLYQIDDKYAVSAIIGQPDGTMIAADNVDLPAVNPEYLLVNSDGTISFAAGTGGVDTLWLINGDLIYPRPGIDSVYINGNLQTSGDVRIGTSKTYNIGTQMAIRFQNNSWYGLGAGNSTASQASNTGIGGYALYSLSAGSLNTAVGTSALRGLTLGTGNVAVGGNALYTITDGSFNTAIGYSAGKTLVTSNKHNTIIGYYANSDGVSNDSCVYVGSQAGRNNNFGDKNVAVGYSSGSDGDGYGNVFIGFKSGKNEAGNNKLYIANNSTAWANGDTDDGLLIYGDFTNNFLNFFNRVSIGDAKNPTNALEVAGTADITGNINIGDTIYNTLTEYDGQDIDDVGRYVYQNTDGYYCYMPEDTMIAKIVAEIEIPETSSDTSHWTKSENYLFQDDLTDSVGIGTNSPDHELDITGDIGISKNIYLPSTTSTAGIIKIKSVNFLHSYGTGNTFTGSASGNVTLSGTYNSGFGERSLYELTSGASNTALGYYALSKNTTGGSNVAIGTNVMAATTNTSSYNIAIGAGGLYRHATGNGNVFIGHNAGYENDFGSTTVALGYEAAYNDTNATSSVYIGYQAGKGSSKHIKSGNIFIGYQAGLNETGSNLFLLGSLLRGDLSTGNMLVNNTVEFDSSPASDRQCNGIVSTHTTGENVTQFQICYMKSDGKLWKADADAVSTMPALWLATDNYNSTEGIFLEKGYVRNDAWNWTVGASSGIIYASPTAGGLTQTLPTSTAQVQQPVGIAITADIMYFCPALFYNVVPAP